VSDAVRAQRRFKIFRSPKTDVTLSSGSSLCCRRHLHVVFGWCRRSRRLHSHCPLRAVTCNTGDRLREHTAVNAPPRRSVPLIELILPLYNSLEARSELRVCNRLGQTLHAQSVARMKRPIRKKLSNRCIQIALSIICGDMVPFGYSAANLSVISRCRTPVIETNGISYQPQDKFPP